MDKLTDNDCLETPRWIIDALGRIDTDPCAGPRTRIGYVGNYCLERGMDGLEMPWTGFVWCNPPYSQKRKWAARMMEHNRGILCLPESGSSSWFGHIAQAAGFYFVIGRRVNFIGGTSRNNNGTVLFLFGSEAVERIKTSGLAGILVKVESFTPTSELSLKFELNA